MTTLSKTPVAPTADLASSAEAVQRGLDQQISVLAGLIVNGAAALTLAVRKAVTSYLAYRAKRRAYDELMSLDARMLSDIGVSRQDVRAIVYGEDLQGTMPTTEIKNETLIGTRPVHA